MPSRSLPLLFGAALCAAALSGCVIISNVDEDKLPAAWMREINPPAPRPPQGRFASAGLIARGAKPPVEGRLEWMFLPGQIRDRAPAETIELATAPDGTFTARAWRGGRVVAEVELPGRLDPKTGWLELERIPVKSTNKFGVTVATQSARVAVGSNGALYVQMSSTEAGVVLFLPAFGTGTVWGRWEPAKP